MNCAEFENRLPDFLGDELPPGDVAFMEQHAATCAACAAELASLGSARAALEMLPLLSPEEAARGRAAAEARYRRKRVAAGFGSLFRYAAILLLGTGLGWMLRSGQNSTATPSELRVDRFARPEPASITQPVHPDWVGYALKADPRQEEWPALARQLALLLGPARSGGG